MSESALNGPLSSFEEISLSSKDADQLKELDNFLKCTICYEYFNTCVITECSHNFCSLCIRSYIQYKTECPVCFCELYDSQLRANRIVDNFVIKFPELKEHLIRHLRTLKTLQPNCMYVSPSKNIDFKTPSKKHQASTSSILITPTKDEKRSTIRPISESSVSASKCNNRNLSDGNKIVIPTIFQSPVKKQSPLPGPNSKFVSCPVCSVEIPERNINLHLDVCLKRAENNTKKKTSDTRSRRNYLPKLVYRLMNAKDLRAKLKEYGLNPQGDNETLKNRIQRYTVLHNAECDKQKPRPVQEIIRQLEKEEKILLGQKLPKSIFSAHSDGVTSKTELNEQYLQQNKEIFDKLVETAKDDARAKKSSNSEIEKTKPQISALRPSPDDYCRPGTSKSSNFYENFADCDNIDIEEMKVEDISNHPPNYIDNDTQDDDDVVITSLSNKHPKRSKRLVFDDCNESNENRDTFIEITPVKIEPYDESTDSDHSPNLILDCKEVTADVHDERSYNTEYDMGYKSDNDAVSSSPVLQKRTRKKRKIEEEPFSKRNLRSKKK